MPEEQGIFSDAVRARLDKAAGWCRAHGQRLTETRRQVLGLILTQDRPSSAYDLLARLRRWQPNAVPPTIYRALDFLLAQGLVHRIERLSAFVGCSHAMECHEDCAGHEAWGVHRAQFLICRSCGQVWEIEQEAVASVLLKAARETGFHPDSATVEIEGLCRTCRGRNADPVRTGH